MLRDPRATSQVRALGLLFVGLASVVALLTACEQPPSHSTTQDATSTTGSPSDPGEGWTALATSPDGRWQVLGTPNQFSDQRLLLTGPIEATIAINGSGTPFGPAAFSPDSTWLIVLVSPDESNPDDAILTAYHLTGAPAPRTVVAASGSLPLPRFYTSSQWTDGTLEFISPQSAYNPERRTTVDLTTNTYITIPNP